MNFCCLLIIFCPLFVSSKPWSVSKIEEREPEFKRLDTFIVPTHYDLHIFVNATRMASYFADLHSEGTVNISVVSRTSTDEFYLNAGSGLQIHSLKIDQSASSNIKSGISLKSYKHYEEESKIYIELNRRVKKGEKFNVRIRYTLSKDRQSMSQGFYASLIGAQMVLSTHHEPIYARYSFPCFDEPSFKATFKISLTHQSQFTALSNMPTTSVNNVNVHTENGTVLTTGWSRSEFETTPKMSTYLVAVALLEMGGKFEATYTSIDGRVIPIRLYTQDHLMGHGYPEKSLELTIKAFELFEQWFQFPYPLPKCDLYTTRIPAFAMENWGLISMSYKLFFPHIFDPIQMSIILAHEIAHQWFGNLVTPEWWNDLWLKEGFASYLSVLTTQNIFKDPHLTSVHLMGLMTTAPKDIFDTDSLNSSKPVSMTIRTESDIVANFDKMFSYGKSCLLIEMIHEMMLTNALEANGSPQLTLDHSQRSMGQRDIESDPLILGSRAYLKKHAYSTASRSDLWESFSDIGVRFPCETVSSIMKTWTEEWGYPEVKFHVNYDTGLIHITQQRFLSDFSIQALPQYSNTKRWTMQLLLRTSKGIVRPVWINQNIHEIRLDPKDIGDWILVETAGRSYYRVNYDHLTWRRLIDAATSPSPNVSSLFSSIQKARMVDDSWALASANRLPLEIPLIMTPNFAKNETDFVFWVTVLNLLRDKLNVYGQSSPIESSFSSYVEKIVAHFPDDSRRQILQPTRDLLTYLADQILTEIRNETFMKTVSSRFEYYLRNNFTAEKNMHIHSIGYAAKYFGINDTTFQKIYDQRIEDPRTFNVLGYYTKDLSQFERVLNLTTSAPLNTSALLVWHPRRFTDCGYYPGGHIMWNYVMQNWEHIWKTTHGDQARAFLIDIHFKTLPFTREKYDQIGSFEAKYVETLGANQLRFMHTKRRFFRYTIWSEDRFWKPIGRWIDKVNKYPGYLI